MRRALLLLNAPPVHGLLSSEIISKMYNKQDAKLFTPLAVFFLSYRRPDAQNTEA